MSEEKKDQRKFAGKYNTPEELEKAYRELEKTLGNKVVNPQYDTAEQVLEKQRKFYGELLNEKSNLEGELRDISSGLSERTALPTPFVDEITSQAAAAVTKASVEARKKAVEDYLDEDKRAQLGACFKSVEDAKAFNKRHELGQVSVEEVKLMLKQGAVKEENVRGIERGKPAISAEEALQRVLAIADNPNHPALRPDHPNHAQAVAEYNELKALAGA